MILRIGNSTRCRTIGFCRHRIATQNRIFVLTSVHRDSIHGVALHSKSRRNRIFHIIGINPCMGIILAIGIRIGIGNYTVTLVSTRCYFISTVSQMIRNVTSLISQIGRCRTAAYLRNTSNRVYNASRENNYLNFNRIIFTSRSQSALRNCGYRINTFCRRMSRNRLRCRCRIIVKVFR